MEPAAGISLSSVQAFRKVVLVACLLVGLTVVAVTRAVVFGHDVHELVEAIGLGLLLVCILGRVWCSLYIGGRKVRELVDHGPYSMTRNPLYVFSVIGAAGVGAQSGSVVMMLLCAAAAALTFAVLVRIEEKALLALHGQAFADYMQRTPRFFPNPALWWDVGVLPVRPVRVMRTFADGLVFLLAIPVAEGLEMLQASGFIPTIANLP